MAKAFPLHPSSPASLLRSWRKEERRQAGQVLSWLRRAGPMALVIVVPLVALQLGRRASAIREQIQHSRDDTVAIMESALAVTSRAARDWGYWDDAYRYMRGGNPGYPINNLGTAALFDGGAVMVLLEPNGNLRLTFSQTNDDPSSHTGLVSCLRENLGRIPSLRSTVRLACRNSDGSLYLGTATAVSDNTATAPKAGTIAMFDPLIKQEYSPRIRERLLTLRRELVLVSKGDRHTTALVPTIYGDGKRVLALRQVTLLPQMVASVLEDIPLLLALVGLVTTVRAMHMLDRRGQQLRNLLVERRANQRIRRVCQSLDQLVEGLDSRHNLAAAPPPLLPGPDAAGPATERRLDQVARRFHQVLVQTRTLALQDPLTQLPNRRHFIDELESRARVARAAGRHMAILFVDIDRFKAINDTYGHAVGDGVLVGVAQRLQNVLRPEDCLARYGGDELALILHLADQEDGSAAGVEGQARRVAQRLGATVRDPMRVGNQSLSVALSIGYSLLDPHEPEIEAVLRRSDLAMYAAKRQRQQQESS